jgi:hypothetical protein
MMLYIGQEGLAWFACVTVLYRCMSDENHILPVCTCTVQCYKRKFKTFALWCYNRFIFMEYSFLFGMLSNLTYACKFSVHRY